VDLHPGEDLLTHEPSLDVDVWSTIDQPGQVDGHWVTFVGGRVFHQVVWQEFLILNLGTLLVQVVVVVF